MVLVLWPEAGQESAEFISLGGCRWLPRRGRADTAHPSRRRQWQAACRLAELFEEHGDLDEAEQILRASVEAGDEGADRVLDNVLIKQGRSEEAEQLRRFGLNPDGSIASA
jgi:uncharacterized protein HemY